MGTSETQKRLKQKTKKKKKNTGKKKALCTQCLHIDELSTAEE